MKFTDLSQLLGHNSKLLNLRRLNTLARHPGEGKFLKAVPGWKCCHLPPNTLQEKMTCATHVPLSTSLDLEQI